MLAVPDRLEEGVREAQVHDVLHRLLAQEVVDAEEALLGKDRGQALGSGRARKARSVPNGFSTTSRLRRRRGLPRPAPPRSRRTSTAASRGRRREAATPRERRAAGRTWVLLGFGVAADVLQPRQELGESTFSSTWSSVPRSPPSRAALSSSSGDGRRPTPITGHVSRPCCEASRGRGACSVARDRR